MLYSLVAAVLILSFFNALVVPFLVIRYFIKGYNINAEREIEPISVLDLPKKHEKAGVNHKVETILRNIDRYDGTSNGQEVVR